ncbi:NUDIX domain-containing protein [Listeria seeligeri]|uniref:NUDIX hydrolase n=1 Tax=Listeria seeligeri TaxID=1640 RepID=UPI002F423C97
MKHIRTVAIIIYDNKILFHSSQDNDYWTLPGGAVEQEFIKEGLIREMREELGEEVVVKELKIIAENKFMYRGSMIDSIEFYFTVKLPEDSSLIAQNSFTKVEEFGQFNEEPYMLTFKWIDVSKLAEFLILPRFLVTELQNLKGNQVKHIENNT